MMDRRGFWCKMVWGFKSGYNEASEQPVIVYVDTGEPKGTVWWW